ncbi:hypothetical protein EYF80_050379 [Liparis tanakae]|uniref:Uncharacterized protein n=1 Tax=Liparis tanakae TaxID=230148 RepID=A0A4Z2FDZ4_9TELE|nr:hypothetical protein EYF80_050379 [Liparis tanakae]
MFSRSAPLQEAGPSAVRSRGSGLPPRCQANAGHTEEEEPPRGQMSISPRVEASITGSSGADAEEEPR